MELIEHIQSAWGWTGINAAEVIGENDFGNLIVRDRHGSFWRICPEDLYCKIVARTRIELDEISLNQEFLQDWYVTALVERAQAQVGPLSEGRKYCLKIPGVLGGEYGGENLASISLVELIEASGSIAKQIEGLPEGANVEFRIVE